MDVRIKELWIEALNSGKYDQGKGFLRKDNCFCVYGVLCDLYAKEHEDVGWELQFGTTGRYSILGFWDFVPDEVLSWAGIFDMASSIMRARKADQVINMNDKQDATFNQLAVFIKDNL